MLIILYYFKVKMRTCTVSGISTKSYYPSLFNRIT